MTEAVMPGPCVICGLSDYPLSAGGPTICPSCDTGDFGPTKIERQRKEIVRLQSLADDMGQTNIMNQIEIERLQEKVCNRDRLIVMHKEFEDSQKAEVERLKAVEAAALALWAVVRRTDEHHEWLDPMGKLGAALERKP